ncbi:MAG: DUF72 domain-containing protein [Sulfuricella sp.]|nr:DUF72 domain-containing protein [Sulfuricella sp.]
MNSHLPAGRKGRIHIGASGWNYPDWRDSFYGGIPSKDWLGFYAARFGAVEVNATFYRQQRQSTFERWREQTPADFVFTIKGHRFLTHVKRLLDPEQPLQTSRAAAAGLGGKLAAVLWQMPRSLRKDMARLQRFADALAAWPEARHALEFRHASWYDDEVAACLSSRRIANCLSDAADWPMWDAVTTDLAYVRLHGHGDTYASVYGEGELAAWAGRVREWQAQGRDVHVYFDNTASGAALDNALRFKALLA